MFNIETLVKLSKEGVLANEDLKQEDYELFQKLEEFGMVKISRGEFADQIFSVTTTELFDLERAKKLLELP